MSRLSLLSSAFRDVPLTVGSHTLRPITAGTVMLLMDVGNILFTESDEEPTESQAMQALFEFMWIHIGPEPEVIRQCDDPAALRAAARAFAMGISFEDLDSFSQQFATIRSGLNAALVEVVPEKGETTTKKPSEARPTPTGSPPSSTPLEAPQTHAESTGSSGASPSDAPSNTSTQPIPQTDPAPAGKSRIWETPPTSPQPQEDPDNVIPID
jgi:hypothetical protein